MPRLGERMAAQLALLLVAAACGPNQKDIESAQIHFDLGVSAMENTHDAQTAIKELRIALQANPNLVDAYNALGLVYHLMLHRPEEAIANYQAGLKIDPKNGEVANNEGAALTDLGRYTEAAAMFERALSNDLYRTPYIAQGNLGWALYKSGDVQAGVGHLKTAVQINPDYCQGYRSLGMIASELGQLAEAETQFRAFEKHCPKLCESHYRLAMVMLKRGDQGPARDQLGLCSSGCPSTDLAVECDRLLKMMQ